MLPGIYHNDIVHITHCNLLEQENLIEDPQIGSARPHGDWMGKFREITPENAALWQFLVLPELRC